jgi:hypothetical protein
MKYQVLDCGKLAKYPYCSVHENWNNCEFDTLNGAINFIDDWLGAYSPGIEALRKVFSNSSEYEYSPNGFISVQLVEKFNGGKV